MSIQVPTKHIYSVEEYLDLETRANERHEYINGAVLPMAGGSPRHNRISPRHNRIKVNLIIALGVALKDTPYQVFDSDQRLWIPENRTFTYPDVVVVREPIITADNDTTAITNPRLIIEVLSDSTRNYDRSQKFVTYRSLPSFLEYLLIEQDGVQIEQHVKQDDRHWLLTIHEDLNAKIPLASIPVEIAIADLYHRV
ncbi:Uma2 family endonuclease [Baaleninema simplex]|uniref:Uma2 family endonuclease n=1 Tax=Baaleninema simplex TaxID=2862350 RepID=UPI0005544115|nr:Uma2 family endonuclease [Baaleninema simplex]